jgi:hypothetical protein
MMVLYFISRKERNTIFLSLVIGVFVKASPAYSTNPMRSFGRPFIKSAATFLSASNRSGFKSFANILAETSIAITISMPRVVFVFVETSTVRGLANAVINNAKAISRSAKSKCLNLLQNEPEVLNP